jgi:hypothetical protein
MSVLQVMIKLFVHLLVTSVFHKMYVYVTEFPGQK